MLAEANTSNTTFAKAATASLDFVYKQAAWSNFTEQSGFGEGGLFSDVDECGPQIALISGNAGTTSLGVMLEAMSIMHDITGDNDMGVRYGLPASSFDSKRRLT